MKCATPAARAPGTSVSPSASKVSASRAWSRRNGTPWARAARGVSRTCAPPTVNASAPSAAPRMNWRLSTMTASSSRTVGCKTIRRPRFLKHAPAVRVDEVHVAQIGQELRTLAWLQVGERVGARADLDAVQREKDERFHAHRLGDVKRNLEGALSRRGRPAQVGDVLGPQAEEQVRLAGMRAIARHSLLRNREGERAVQAQAQGAGGLLERAADDVHRRRADEAGDEQRRRR